MCVTAAASPGRYAPGISTHARRGSVARATHSRGTPELRERARGCRAIPELPRRDAQPHRRAALRERHPARHRRSRRAAPARRPPRTAGAARDDATRPPAAAAPARRAVRARARRARATPCTSWRRVGRRMGSAALGLAAAARCGRVRITSCVSFGTCMSSRFSTTAASELRLTRSRISLRSCARCDWSCRRCCSSASSAFACACPCARPPDHARADEHETEQRQRHPGASAPACRYAARRHARSRALRARGLRRDLLARAAVTALRVHALAERHGAAHADRLARRTRARIAPVAECVLHHAVLARVIRDHRHCAARRETVAQRGQRALERPELVVHLNANRLEDAREVAGPLRGPSAPRIAFTR